VGNGTQSAKVPCYEFFAKRRNTRQSPIDVSSSAPPKSAANSSLVDVVPHMIIRLPRLQPGKIVFSYAKRFLQHYLPISEVPDATLRRRQKQRHYSRVSIRTWGPMTRYRRVKFLNASAPRSNCFPFRPNGVTIRRQGTKAPVKTLELRDRRSPLTTWRMSRIAKGSYCRARCSQKQALARIAKSGGLRFRSELPAVLLSRRGGCQCWRFLTRTRLRYAQPH
jgi:hypothetical protein